MNLSRSKFELIFEHGILRTLIPKDVHQGYISGLNDPEINRYLTNVAQSNQTLESVTGFIKNSFESQDEMLFGIWSEHNKNHCGTVRIHSIDSYHRIAHIGICIFDKNSWGKGLATHAIRRVTQWGLDVLELRWVEAGVYEGNLASSRLFERAGYKLKYSISGKYLHKGEPSTVFVYAFCSDT